MNPINEDQKWNIMSEKQKHHRAGKHTYIEVAEGKDKAEEHIEENYD